MRGIETLSKGFQIPLPFKEARYVARSARFEANDFTNGQFKIQSDLAGNTVNLCGHEVYRERNANYAGTTPGDHGELFSYSGHRVEGYDFTSLPFRDYPAALTDTALSIGHGADGYVFQIYNSANHATYYYGDKAIGGLDLLQPVSRAYLAQSLETWTGQSPDFHRNHSDLFGLGWDGFAASLSESESGGSALAVGSTLWSEEDLTVGVFSGFGLGFGFPNAWNLTLQTTVRKNSATFINNEKSGLYETYFPATLSKVDYQLSEEITALKWLDDSGKYDPGQASAFAGLGYRWAQDVFEVLFPYDPLHNYVTNGIDLSVEFCSMTGADYRITLSWGYFTSVGDEDGVWTEVQAQAPIAVSLAVPGVFVMPRNLPANDGSSGSLLMRVTRVESLVAGVYTDITDRSSIEGAYETYSLLGERAPDVMRAVAKPRQGVRWGFYAIYPFQTQEVRYAKKIITREEEAKSA